ncbi:hypothetical protein PMG11_07678 [Penicillium brasilianum]|uniref:Transcription factor domain-containing protein n=1 Tax=Penicillium brasilianum TaxID=104259 RepID=A0A0F7TTC2_PENBI|nr:hypothetical protein PMG11_07678 [Penicillium brasilianum]
MVDHQELGIRSPYHFVTIQSSNGDGTARRLARSHAVARGLENNRKAQLKLGHNFRMSSPKTNNKRSRSRTNSTQALANQTYMSFSASSGFFHWLATESPKLHGLLNRGTSKKPIEPALSASDELVLQNFRPILRTGPDDDLLLSAIMLTFSFASNAGHFDRECLEYQNAALSSVRQRIGSPNKATMESTLGSILLLAGVEVRLNSSVHWQWLKSRRLNKEYHVSDGIKRAIFWSDLNAAVIAGSTRVVDHTTFSELHWKRDPFSPEFFTLPAGFQAQSHLLSEGFVEILKDICALQCIRDSALFDKEDVVSMAHIDNHQASIQSRLVDLPDVSLSPISDCCQIAAYLCSTMLRCKIWRTSTIPSHLSLQLLGKLQDTNQDTIWNHSPELLIWILHVGGAFAPPGAIRMAYVDLLHLNFSTRLKGLCTTWAELRIILQRFIWSEKAFMSQIKAFWEEYHVQYLLE